jgi:hypothetical protein
MNLIYNFNLISSYSFDSFVIWIKFAKVVIFKQYH